MDVRICIEGKVRKMIDKRVERAEKLFWRELEKLRARIVKLNIEVKRLKEDKIKNGY